MAQPGGRDSRPLSDANRYRTDTAILRYAATVTGSKSALREQFEAERRRSAFFSFLSAAGIGIIITDTWISRWFGVPGGLAAGGFAYGLVYGYETLMWRKHHGRSS